jgi:hypothetical protein
LPKGGVAIKRFFNARRVLADVELVHKIIKGPFGLPDLMDDLKTRISDPN